MSVAKILKALRAFRELLLREILIFPVLRRARRQIQAELKQESERSITGESVRSGSKGLEVARRHLLAETERRRIVEDKAKTNVVAITLAFSVLFAGLGFLAGNDVTESLGLLGAGVALAFLVAGAWYLIYGGLRALEALRVGAWYTLRPEDEVTLPEADLTAELLFCVRRNQWETLTRTNALAASYASIRNGIMSLATLVIILAFPIFASTSKREPTGDASAPASVIAPESATVDSAGRRATVRPGWFHR